MKKSQIIIASYLLPVVMAVICSKLYWGYYFRPPTINLPKYLTEINHVLSISYRKNDREIRIKNITNNDIEKEASLYLKDDANYPYNRLSYYIKKYGFKPDNKNDIDNNTKEIALETIKVFRKSGIEVQSEEGYDSTKYLFCSMAIGKDKNNNNIVVVSAHGCEVSNDHHPQYNVVYSIDKSNDFQLIKKDIYFEDIAGIEGARAHIIAAIFMALWTLILVIILIMIN